MHLHLRNNNIPAAPLAKLGVIQCSFVKWKEFKDTMAMLILMLISAET